MSDMSFLIPLIAGLAVGAVATEIKWIGRMRNWSAFGRGRRN